MRARSDLLKGRGRSALELNLICFAIITASFMLTLYVHAAFIYAPGILTPLSDAFGIFYIAYAMSFAFLYSNKRFARLSMVFAAASIMIFAAAMFGLESFNTGVILFSGIYPLIVIYAISIPTLVIILLGFYLFRNNKFAHAKSIAAALFVAAIILFIVYQIYIFGYVGIGSDDEMVIAYYALQSMLAGHNPYLFNSAGILTKNIARYGFTMLTNNTVIGRLDYPALFMLSGWPFYSIFGGTPANILDYGNAAGYLVMFLLSLLVFGAVIGKKALADMKMMAPIIFVFLLYSLQIVSFQYSIAIILLILTVKYIDSKYVFVLLGLAASLQELLWVPVILALVYIATTKGLRSAGRIAALSIGVFLLINGYFIAIGPGTYILQVFKPLNGDLLPFYLTSVSSIIQAYANIPLSGFSTLFYIMLLLGVAITAYSGNKLTVLTGMFLSYLALDHALLIYYLMPMVVMASAFAMGIRISEKSKLREWIAGFGISDVKAVACIAIVFAISLVASTAYLHHSYVQNFGVSAADQSILTIRNSTYDRVVFKSVYGENQNVYLLGFYYLRNSPADEEGLSLIPNHTITNSSCIGNCTASGYMNTNIATLRNGYSTVYISVPDNATVFDCAVYKNGFYYLCPPISASNLKGMS